MDKRIDELEEINLKVVDDVDGAVSVPDSATPDAAELDVTVPSPVPDLQANLQNTSEVTDPTGGGEGLESKSRSARFSKTTIRKTFLVVVLGALAVCANNGLKSFWSSPISSQSIVFLGPSIFSAWCGELDSANALQALPTMAVEVSSTGAALPPQRRAAVVASLERFVGSAPVEKRLMSTLVDAVMLAVNGKSDRAAVLLRELDSNSPLVSGFHAAVQTMIGQYPAALETCDRGIRVLETSSGSFAPSTYDALWSVKAEILIAMGRPEDALRVLELPGFPEKYKEDALKRDNILEAKAAAYLRSNQPDQAIKVACQMRQLNHMILSTAYLMEGDIAEAEQHAGKSYLALSKIYSKTGRLEEALKYAKLADQANLGVAGREQHVFVLNQMGRFREAIALSTDLAALPKVPFLLESMHNMPELHADLAWAYAKLGEIRQAREHANWALNVDPNCRQALEAERLVSQITGDKEKYEAYDSRLKNLQADLYDRPVLFTNKNTRY